MTTTGSLPTILLIPGHWLGAWAWDEVAEHLDPAREWTTAMTLPGLDPADPARATRTLDDQVEAILTALADADAADLEGFRTRAVPEPGPVLRQPIALSNPQCHAVPTTLVCCSLSSAQVRELADAGHPMFAEVALLEDVTAADLPTGHWPMWSRPADLAAVIRAEAAR